MHHIFFGQYVAACPSGFALAEVQRFVEIQRRVRKQVVEAEKESR